MSRSAWELNRLPECWARSQNYQRWADSHRRYLQHPSSSEQARWLSWGPPSRSPADRMQSWVPPSRSPANRMQSWTGKRDRDYRHRCSSLPRTSSRIVTASCQPKSRRTTRTRSMNCCPTGCHRHMHRRSPDPVTVSLRLRPRSTLKTKFIGSDSRCPAQCSCYRSSPRRRTSPGRRCHRTAPVVLPMCSGRASCSRYPGGFCSWGSARF